VKRREFITFAGGAAAWPMIARAQQPATPVIGVLNSRSPGEDARLLAAFRKGLGETGYVEGQNVTIEYRWAEGQYDRMPALAADLVRRQVTLIATPGSTPGALAAKAATSTIPIVFGTGADPVAAGLVPSLRRPGGNITGITSLSVEIGPKRLELIHELVPAATILALLVNPTNPTLAEAQSRDFQKAARALGLQLHILHASTERDFEMIFESLAQLGAGALLIGADQLFNSYSERLAALAIRYSVPAIYQYPEFAAAGGLMSYGGSILEEFHLAGVYAGRILKGEKPADLPVQQATKVELIINLKTAKALGITIPLSLLTRADQVIE
jgi:putative tryptophan/tyrosine transport system substrate-binding protein